MESECGFGLVFFNLPMYCGYHGCFQQGKEKAEIKTGQESENSLFNVDARKKLCTGFAMLIETTTQDCYILCPKYRIEECNYVGCHFLKRPEQIINVWKTGLRKGLHKP